MTPLTLADLADRAPTPAEIDNAADAVTAIARQKRPDGTLVIGDLTLSAPLVELMSDLFGIVARGDTATFVPLSRRLTTQEAADLLNVSRPFLIKLIDQGKLVCEMAGTHRRLALSDVLRYKADRSTGRRKALAEMQDIAEDLDDA